MSAAELPGSDEPVDIALVGGRVIDPETGLDEVRTVGITGGRVSWLRPEAPAAARTIDVTGLVVAPGFIDLHSHAQSLVGSRLQALDGVTTALDLEAGRYPVAASLDAIAQEGRPINYGFSTGWSAARCALVTGENLPLGTVLPAFDSWQAPLAGRPVEELMALLDAEIADGALGIGVLLGYAPDVTRAEYLALAQLAHDRAAPTFTHTRYLSNAEPGSSLEGMLEVIAAAAATGAHMHVCHLNSTSSRQIDQVAAAIGRARDQGLTITTEAYPYGAGATHVDAAFLDPENLPRMRMEPTSILVLKTGRHLRDVDELIRLRAEEPDAEVITHWADENDPADVELLLRSLLLSDTAIATDSMDPSMHGVPLPGDEWPLREGALTHPRSVGCYGKVFRWIVRELGALTLPEAVRRCSLVPADVLASVSPTMRLKGRVQVGCDADLVVFDPDTFADRADYAVQQPSTGVAHLFVGGTPVVRDGQLDLAALPGRAVTGS